MASRATAGTVALRAACKEYGGRRVVSDLSLTVAPGRIHALIGENGAGKSTALSMLAGLASPDGGSVVIDDRPVTLRGRMAAIAAGIGLVPQHLSLVAELTLVENLALTHPHQVVRRGHLRASLLAAATAADLSIRPDVPVARLSFAERQLGELAIALAQGARTLLLDEPTSSIGPYETGRLFERLRAAAADGAAILVVTHRIDEVRRYADDVTVLSLGTMRLRAQTATVDDATLVSAMVGHIPEQAPRRRQRQTAAPRLTASSIDVRADAGLTGRLTGVALSVEPGEILGILGVAGSGQSLLAQIAAGVRRPDAGTVMVDGNEMTGDPAKARRLGLAYVPEERRNAFLPAAPLAHSSLLGRRIDAPEFVRRGMLRWDRIGAYAREVIARHDVRPPDPTMPAQTFSGGNQQKFLVGRELDGAPSVIVLHSPTQGLDVHAAATIRNAVRSAADRGAAVLLISADVDEVLELSDRVAVLSQGQIVDLFAVDEYDRDRVGRAMAGLANA